MNRDGCGVLQLSTFYQKLTKYHAEQKQITYFQSRSEHGTLSPAATHT